MDTKTIGKKYSFIELIQDNNYKISIPLIQRDFVQGKPNKKEIRQEFLTSLKSYLKAGENKDLDFVYGYEREENFIPLDGQQRLTTLFLLHTYLAFISNNRQDWKTRLHDGSGLRFNYEVRRSSNDFCNCLVNEGIDFKDLNESGSRLVEYVQNLHWYKSSWSYDPTIVSMLHMLEEINVFFADSPHFYHILTSTENPVITFLFLNLQSLKQGDDLYIKMNARGKTLTAFENFKARFEESVDKLFRKDDIQRTILHNGQQIKYGTKEYFSFKIDSVWSELFWKYRGVAGNPNTFDDEIFSFIKEILLYHYIEQSGEDNKGLETILNEKFETFNQLNTYPLITRNSINFLIDVLDVLEYDDSGIKKNCNNIYFNEEDVFRSVLEDKIQNPDRVKFYAYLKYLLSGNPQGEQLQHWMRVVVNLVENKIMNAQEMIVPAFRSIKDLLPYSSDILAYLRRNGRVNFFDSDQIIEERIKANLIALSTQFYVTIFEVEQSVFHKAQIGYLLELSGILENVDFNTNALRNNIEADQLLTIFNQFCSKAVSFFKQLENNADYTFERAILSYGNYLIKKGDQYNFSSSRSVSNYERDYSWKRMLKLDYNNLLDSTWRAKRNIFYSILQDSSFDFHDTSESLKQRIKNFNENDWRYDFIKQPEFIGYCKQGFIQTTDNFANIQLLNASQMNHLRTDYYVYKAWLDLDEEEYPSFQFNLVPVRGSSETPYIHASDFIYERKNFAVQFYNLPSEGLFIRLLKMKGYNRLEDYPSVIANIAKELKLYWTEDNYHKGFIYSSSVYKTSVMKLHNLLVKLEELKK
ncbi:MAG: hypothetical protein K0S09_1325 [Sphingobacteriaceae bacterium]|jgi:hypothetical protein|nr:hypothetical protein [Sphingobacteriaceae bacterium]